MHNAILQAYLEGDQTALLALRDYALDEGMDDQAQMWETAIQGRNRLDSLTQVEEKLLDVVAQHWIGVSHKTGPTDRALCEQLVDGVYQVNQLEPPRRKEWARSPLGLERFQVDAERLYAVRNRVWGTTTHWLFNSVSNKAWGTVQARVLDRVQEQPSQRLVSKMQRLRARGQENVIGFGTHDAYWLAFRHFFLLLGLTGTQEILPLIQFSQQCGWWMAGKDVVVLSDLPIACTENEIVYADGFTVNL